ncbi:MAG: hypothetical protein NT123_18230, partial [Proteobacteria bacterium]|nr:hypothetical protein [Pseudomonadota bacterium]
MKPIEQEQEMARTTKTSKAGTHPASPAPKAAPQAKDAAAPAVTDGAVSPAPPHTAFPIVGIGASAGGLAAFEAFFSGMPAKVDPGMAFVLVQHLAPDHKSIL